MTDLSITITGENMHQIESQIVRMAAEITSRPTVSIDSLGLSTRPAGALERKGIQYLHQLACVKEHELECTPNLGSLGIEEIKEVMGRSGLELAK